MPAIHASTKQSRACIAMQCQVVSDSSLVQGCARNTVLGQGRSRYGPTLRSAESGSHREHFWLSGRSQVRALVWGSGQVRLPAGFFPCLLTFATSRSVGFIILGLCLEDGLGKDFHFRRGRSVLRQLSRGSVNAILAQRISGIRRFAFCGPEWQIAMVWNLDSDSGVMVQNRAIISWV